MRTVMLYAAVLLLCLACSSCENKPGRPGAELCTWQFERQVWECEDTSNHTRVENDQGDLMCTTLDGYLKLEKYIDTKEAKVRELQRELDQCRKSK